MKKTFDHVDLDDMRQKLDRAIALAKYVLTQDDIFTQKRAEEGFTRRFVHEALYEVEELKSMLLGLSIQELNANMKTRYSQP